MSAEHEAMLDELARRRGRDPAAERVRREALWRIEQEEQLAREDAEVAREVEKAREAYRLEDRRALAAIGGGW